MQDVTEGNHMTTLKIPLLALLLAGGAAPAGETAVPAAPATPAEATASAETAKPVKVKECVPVSGTRIRPSPATGCRSSVQPMRTYTQEDIQRTGQIDLNQALRMLDPIFH